jgi:hypothetical protein
MGKVDRETEEKVRVRHSQSSRVGTSGSVRTQHSNTTFKQGEAKGLGKQVGSLRCESQKDA